MRNRKPSINSLAPDESRLLIQPIQRVGLAEEPEATGESGKEEPRITADEAEEIWEEVKRP